MGGNLDHFVVQACNTTGEIIINQEIQEEAISSSRESRESPQMDP